ncbi:MAG: hypothetical protein ACKV19_04160 [Verrucomicrobiales bacterium]
MKTQVQTQTVPKNEDLDANRDPISGAPGAHPVGTGLGATGGAAAGAAIGSVAGPVGTAVGLVAGAIAGGLAGKGIAEVIDPTAENAYWRANYATRPYVETGVPYEAYAPAFRTGYQGRVRYHNRRFEDVESDLKQDYENGRGDSPLMWEQAKQATRDAWHRVERALPGDADGDGR